MDLNIQSSGLFKIHIKGYVMKLRMTGFENHIFFVIRLVPEIRQHSREGMRGPPLKKSLVSVFLFI